MLFPYLSHGPEVGCGLVPAQDPLGHTNRVLGRTPSNVVNLKHIVFKPNGEYFHEFRESERETYRHKRQRERERQKETVRDRERLRETGRDREGQRVTERDRE